MANQNTVGNVAGVRFIKLGNATLRGKVDTGAELSSLHVDEYRVEGSVVFIRSGEISENVFRVPLVKTVTVRNSDGQTEKRPVIKTSVEIDGRFALNAVEFTLNDRSKNEFPVLIGQNALKAGSLVVDPQKSPVTEDREMSVIVSKSSSPDLPINVVNDPCAGVGIVGNPDPLNEIIAAIKNSGLKCWEIMKAMEEMESPMPVTPPETTPPPEEAQPEPAPEEIPQAAPAMPNVTKIKNKE